VATSSLGEGGMVGVFVDDEGLQHLEEVEGGLVGAVDVGRGGEDLLGCGLEAFGALCDGFDQQAVVVQDVEGCD
jgi:hypothetical protein